MLPWAPLGVWGGFADASHTLSKPVFWEAGHVRKCRFYGHNLHDPAGLCHNCRYYYEYERNGTVNLFMLFAPLEGWRHVKVTERHAALDYAQLLKDLSDRHFPAASKIV